MAEQGRRSGVRAAFDNEQYLRQQSEAILQRVAQFDNKLYLEFGGKLLYDYHAARVLPGFDPNVKMRLLQQLRDKTDIILCIYAGDIERKKVRADFGITYDSEVFRLIDEMRERGLEVSAVVITRFTGQPAANVFKSRLERRGLRVYTHRPIAGYPADLERIVSDEGYGANPFVETTRPLVVVTAPGPNSGKMGTCLSQIYHESKRGVGAGYAKFETFPIWNLPLRHPVNAAYEAATAELRDVNLIDPFHLEAHGAPTVNYNRDVEAFPVLRRILEKITGARSIYQSPTDMGVNRAGFAIIDDDAAQQAARQEIIRRCFRYECEYMIGLVDQESVERIKLLMQEFAIKAEDRPVVEPARRAAVEARQQEKGNKGAFVGAAVELRDGTIVTGCNSPLMHASSSVVLNAVKTLAEIPQRLHLLSLNIIDSIARMKHDIIGRTTVSLDLDETLITLSICSTTNDMARLAVEQLAGLRGCEMHMTHLPSPGDEKALRELGVNLTCDPSFATGRLFEG